MRRLLIAALAFSAVAVVGAPGAQAEERYSICLGDTCIGYNSWPCGAMTEVGAIEHFCGGAQNGTFIKHSDTPGGHCGAIRGDVVCKGGGNAAPSGSAAPAYVVGRYYCAYQNGSDAGDCDVTTYGSTCPQAHANQQSYVGGLGGDPCKVCGGVTDNSKHWITGRLDWIQGGQCTGQ
jgi:hypothetical protein